MKRKQRTKSHSLEFLCENNLGCGMVMRGEEASDEVASFHFCTSRRSLSIGRKRRWEREMDLHTQRGWEMVEGDAHNEQNNNSHYSDLLHSGSNYSYGCAEGRNWTSSPRMRFRFPFSFLAEGAVEMWKVDKGMRT